MSELDDREDDLLSRAFREARDEHDGASPDAELTLERVLRRTRATEKRRRTIHWFLIPAAAVLVASTAFAGATGRLSPAVRAVIETLHAGGDKDHAEQRAPASTPPSAKASVATSVAVAVSSPEAAPITPPPRAISSETEPPPALKITAAIKPAPRPTAAVATAVDPPSAPSAPREVNLPSPAPPRVTDHPESDLFAQAHRLHFVDRDPARALAAWDRYLRAASASDGRFIPEARYNRALALIRLGRRDEARRELEAFASGELGAYHQEDARELLAALRP